MMSELLIVLSQIDCVLPEMEGFLKSFDTTMLQNNINIITDADSNMYMDIPRDMPEEKVQNVKKRLEIIDRLIGTKAEEAEKLLKKGSDLESALKKENPNQKSMILDRLEKYNKLKSSYKHL